MNEKSVSLPQRLLAETLGTAFLLAAVVRIGNSVEDGLSNWVLHEYYSVRGSVFDRTLQTSPAKAAAGDALHHRGRDRGGTLGPDLQGLPARRRPE
jgi:hypothetical protein